MARQLWAWAEELVKAAAGTRRSRACSDFNQSLMELGALLCTPKSPACGKCPLARRCQAHAMGREEDFPQAGERPKVTPRWFEVMVVEWCGKYAVRQRPAAEVNGGLWEFPNFEVNDLTGTLNEVVGRGLAEMGLSNHRKGGEGTWKPRWLATVRHSITRYRMTQRAHWLRWNGRVGSSGGSLLWKARPEMDALPFTTAHRRILRALPPENPGRSRGGEEKLHES